MRKNKTGVVVVIILALVAALLLLTRSGGAFRHELKDFALVDTATVTRIFMADKSGHSVDLKRLPSGSWTVNDNFTARYDAVVLLMKTMMNMEVMEPVAKAAHNNVIKRLASTGVKVETYQQVYRIDLFGKIRLFPHVKRTKVYYVGSNTMDNIGTYMLLENSPEPFIVYLPGFRGFISVRFSPRVEDWRDHTIFNQRIKDIKSISMDFAEIPASSFRVTNNDDRSFTLTALSNAQKINDYDTTKLLDFLVGFNNIKYEYLLNDLPKAHTDSVKSSKPFLVMSLEEKTGKKVVVKLFHKVNSGTGYDMKGNLTPYDPDRMDALVNDMDLVSVQYFVFDNILKPLEYFLKASPGK